MDDNKKDLKKTISKVVKSIEDKSGEIDLESAAFLVLRDRVRKNPEDSRNTMEILLEFLKFNSSHTRRCALLLLDYFYMKSPRFRDLLNNFLYELIVHAAETEAIAHPLPPPKKDALLLKTECIKVFQKWDKKFGRDDVRLQIAVTTLRNARTIDYDRICGETRAEITAREEKERRVEEYGRMRMAEISQEFSESAADIERNVREAKELLLILIPSFIDESDSSTSTAADLNAHGYGIGESFTISISKPIPEVITDESNLDVIHSAIDVLKQLTMHLSRVERWMRTATRYCKDSSLNQYIELWKAVKAEMEKLGELNLRLPVENPSDGEEEDEFVNEDEQEKHEEDADQPSTSSGITKDKAIKKVAFGLDLKYWGEKKQLAQIPRNTADSHNFWRAPEESEEVSAKAETYEQRVFTYIGEEQRGTRKCGARLKDGGRCPRMDVARCPVHGNIIDRDDEGFPIDEQRDQEKSRQEREDEEYMQDLEAQIGCSLRGKDTRKERKRKREAREERSGRAVRQRLETKLLNPRTIKRVSAVLDEMRMAKIQKNFGDQHAHRRL